MYRCGMHDFFKQILAAGWAGMETWKTERQPETFQLEFKGKSNEAPKLNDYARMNISRTVSGFANVSGGVLLLGIDTAKEEGVDRVHMLRPANNLTAYVEAVNAHLRVCTDPRVPGAYAVGIEGEQSDTGVVALYVPASDGGPHRAKAAGKEVSDLYFARQGTHTVALEHPLLAAMFGRVPPPVLGIKITRMPDNGYSFRVFNRGRGLARYVLVRLGLDSSIRNIRTNAQPRDQPRTEQGWRRVLRRSSGHVQSWAFAFDGVIYGDDDVMAFHFQFPKDMQCDSLRVRGRIDAEGMAPVTFEGDCPEGDEEHVIG